MLRYPRKLPHNKTTRSPGNLLFVDSETMPTQIVGVPNSKVHLLRLWCGISCRMDGIKQTRVKEHLGKDADSFWQLVYRLSDERRPLYVFAHNLGFDLTALRFWRELESGRITLQCPHNWRGSVTRKQKEYEKTGLIVLADPPTIIEAFINCSRKRIVFLDTLNYYRCSLEELGKEFGIPKLPMPQFEADDWRWVNYCKNDVRIIERAMLAWIRVVRYEDLGDFKYTVSGQAFAAYKHRFMQEDIILHRDEEALKLEMESYFGGEVRQGYCGRFGNAPDMILRQRDENGTAYISGPVYQLDVCSFYPSVMSGTEYPVELVGKCVAPRLEELDCLLDKYAVIARVKIASEYNDYPVRYDGKTLHAVGSFVTTLTTPDLRRALACGDIRGIGLVSYYRQAEIFTRFVLTLYANRQRWESQGKKEMAYLHKLLMNSLYGKFGQRDARWVNEPEIDPPIPFGLWHEYDETNCQSKVYRSINWQCQREVPEEERGVSAESFPAIAAHVTAYGRDVMRRYRDVLPPRSFIYQDTDSLHVTEAGYESLKDAGFVGNSGLGILRLVGVYDSGFYRGHKNYTVDGREVIAGLKRNAKYKGGGTYLQSEFIGLESVLASVPPTGPIEKEVIFDLSNWETHGRLMPDGQVLQPAVGPINLIGGKK